MWCVCDECDVCVCVFVYATALQLEVSNVCGEDTSKSYQELVDANQSQMETASE